MTGPLFEIRQLVKTYGSGDAEVQALRGINMQVQPGEFVAIMGPSGSGKSTLMNILGCLDRPTSGTYVLNGEDVSKLNKDQLADVRNREIGFIFQSYNLLPRLGAVRNVMLPLVYVRHRHVPDKEARDLAVAALGAVGLADRINHRPNQLSGGQQQRVAIARALVTSPAIILADELTGNLDSTAGREIMMLLEELHRQGRTIVMVTHDPGAAAYTERTVRLLDGQISSDLRNGERRVA